MKQLLCSAVLALSTFAVVAAPKSDDKQKVRDCITRFSTYAGDRDIAGMERILHTECRVIANQLMGGDAVSLIDKKIYLQFLRDGKFGGEHRSATMKELDITGNNASAKVVFTGKESTFTTYMLFVKSKAGTWSIISDLPFVSAT